MHVCKTVFLIATTFELEFLKTLKYDNPFKKYFYLSLFYFPPFFINFFNFVNYKTFKLQLNWI